jgi:hypothetical protein
MDIENELLNHLTVKDSLEFVIKEGLSTDLIYTPVVKSVYNFVQHHFNSTGKIPTLTVLEYEYPDIT